MMKIMNKKNIIKKTNIITLNRYRPFKDKPPTNWIDMLIPINAQVPITTLIQAGNTEKDITRSLSKGLIFEPKKGLISRL